MPVKVLLLSNFYLLGGQERQTVMHLESVDRSRWQLLPACLYKRGEHLETIRALGYEPIEFNVKGSMLQANTLWQVARMVATIRREHIGVVHANDIYTNL